MYYYVVHNGSAPWWKFLENISKFQQLLIRGLIKDLSPGQAIFSTSLLEVHYLRD